MKWRRRRLAKIEARLSARLAELEELDQRVQNQEARLRRIEVACQAAGAAMFIESCSD